MLPMRCVLCAGAATAAVCAPCAADFDMLRLDNPCPRCGLPMAAGICPPCDKNPPPLDRLHVRHRYETPLDALIQQFKFGMHWQMADSLARLIPPPPPFDAVLPVPLFAGRERLRGFNQSRELVKRMRLRPADGLLTRIVDTAPQTQLSGMLERAGKIPDVFHADSAVRGLALPLLKDVMARIVGTPPPNALRSLRARVYNMHGAFRADAAVRGLSLLLVDDVMTSGATLFEAARTLKNAGAKRVEAVVVARTVPR